MITKLNQKNIQFLSNNSLKIVAITTMFIDHFAKALLFPWIINIIAPKQQANIELSEFEKIITNMASFDYYAVGRMAMPIFCFLIAEGFYHTSNKKKYLIGLLFFAFASELFYDLALYTNCSAQSPLPYCTISQNVIFTMFLGALLLQTLELIKQKTKNKIISFILGFLTSTAFCYIAFLLKTDFDYLGIIYILSFYALRKHRILQVLNFLTIYTLKTMAFPSIFIATSAFLMMLYNNKKGSPNLKSFFYLFYPLHLFFLYLFALIFVYSKIS